MAGSNCLIKVFRYFSDPHQASGSVCVPKGKLVYLQVSHKFGGDFQVENPIGTGNER